MGEDTDMEVMVDTDMEGMVDTDMVPDTVFLDTELDTDLDTDMEVTDVAMPGMEVTVLDTAMVDTVARDPLMPGTDVVMAVMVDTDTESKHFPPNSPKKPYYTKFCHLYHCRNECTHFTKKVSTFIDKDNLKMRENFDRNLP